MQFTHRFIGFVAVFLFATTFLPRHWWHECHHHEEIHARAAESDVTLSPPKCPICSVIIPWFTQTPSCVIESVQFHVPNRFLACSITHSCAVVYLEYPGRAPPAVLV